MKETKKHTQSQIAKSAGKKLVAEMLADYCAEVGWNILGNYIMTVRNTKRTIMSSLSTPARLSSIVLITVLQIWQPERVAPWH